MGPNGTAFPAPSQTPVDRGHLLYGFLTSAPSAVVKPINPNPMPVILTTNGKRDVECREDETTRHDLRCAAVREELGASVAQRPDVVRLGRTTGSRGRRSIANGFVA